MHQKCTHRIHTQLQCYVQFEYSVSLQMSYPWYKQSGLHLLVPSMTCIKYHVFCNPGVSWVCPWLEDSLYSAKQSVIMSEML